MESDLLSWWPPQINRLALFGGILLIGLLGGRIVSLTGFLPRITGFILTGFLAGPSVLGLINPGLLDQARVFVDIALGLILFQLGWILDFKTLWQDRVLLTTGVLESAAAFALIFLVLVWLNISPIHAALGVSTSPAVVLLVVRELGARGPVTEKSLSLVAINNVLAFLAFGALLPFLHVTQKTPLIMALLQPAYRLAGALLLSYVLGRLLIWISRFVGKSENVQFALFVGMIVLALGMANILHVSMLLTLLMLGVFARNLDHERYLVETEFGHGGEVFFVILLVVAGADLHLRELGIVGWAAPAFVLARFVGKSLAVLGMAKFAGLGLVQAVSLGLTLVPMAGLAIGLSQMTSRMYPEFGATLSAIVLAAVAILETIGPVLTEYALKRAGEAHGNGSMEDAGPSPRRDGDNGKGAVVPATGKRKTEADEP